MERKNSAAIKIPGDAIIPVAKLTRYLLVERVRNDKSEFLAQAGFVLDNHEALDGALRKLILSTEAVEDRKFQFVTLVPDK